MSQVTASIVIVGPGAVGGVVAAHLVSAARHRVVVAARSPLDRIEAETPNGPRGGPVQAVTEPSALGSDVDGVLVATKAYDSASTAPWLEAAPASAWVAVLQNGVEHRERFAPFVAPERIVPVVVACPAERFAPGVVRQRGPARLTVPDDANGQAFAGLFAGTDVVVDTTADLRTAAWRKLCLNAAGAVPALILATGPIARRPEIAELMRELVRESIAVGRAEGALLDDALAEEVVASARAAKPGAMNSLHADRAAGKRLETDARNGAIVRLGKKHGIPTPWNALLVAMLDAGAS